MIVNAPPVPGSHEYRQAHGTWFPQGYHPYSNPQGNKNDGGGGGAGGSVQGAASQTVTTEGADPSLEAAGLDLGLPAAGFGELSAESVTDPAVDPEAIVPEEVVARHGYNPSLPSVRAQEGFAAVDAGPFPTHGYWPLMNQMPFAQQFRDFAQEHGTYNPNLPTVRRFMGTTVSATATPDTASSGEFSGLSSLMGPSIVDYLREHYQAPEQYPDRPAYGPVSVSRGVSMNRGGMVDDAMRLQNAGTGDHNRLVHMTQGEVDAMNQLARAGIGGLRTNGMAINPETGLPEAGLFSSILPMVAGLGATIFTGGAASPLLLGAASAGGSLLGQAIEGEGIDLGKTFLAGLGGWGAGQLGNVFGSAGADAAAAQAANVSQGQAVAGAANLGPDAFSQALQAGAPIGAPVTPMAHNFAGQLTSAGSNLGSGAGGQFIPGISGTQGYLQNLSANLPADQLANIGNLAGTQGTDAALRELSQQAYLASPDKIGLIAEGAGSFSPTQWASTPGTVGLKETLAPGGAVLASAADSFGMFDPPQTAFPEDPLNEYQYGGPYLPRDRNVLTPPTDYQHGVDPAFQYYSYANKGGYVGGLPTIKAFSGYGMQRGGPKAQNTMQQQQQQQGLGFLTNLGQGGGQPMAAPQSIYSIDAATALANAQKQRPMPTRRMEGGTRGKTPTQSLDEMYRDSKGRPYDIRRLLFGDERKKMIARTAGLDFPTREKEYGGVAGEPVNVATDGLMAGADPAMQAAVAERDMVTPSVDQPQNPEERAVYDMALLALQGQLEPEEAQSAITEFIDIFGPEAYRMLEALVNQGRDKGGVIKPANGETTVGMTEQEAMAQQGPDVIPGKIVDPQTGEQTANLLVGENEYIEPADSLSRRAMAAGMQPTPHNGAMVRGMEEDKLRAMYG
jgi:hypothetical protein